MSAEEEGPDSIPNPWETKDKGQERPGPLEREKRRAEEKARREREEELEREMQEKLAEMNKPHGFPFLALGIGSAFLFLAFMTLVWVWELSAAAQPDFGISLMDDQGVALTILVFTGAALLLLPLSLIFILGGIGFFSQFDFNRYVEKSWKLINQYINLVIAFYLVLFLVGSVQAFAQGKAEEGRTALFASVLPGLFLFFRLMDPWVKERARKKKEGED